MYDTHKARQVDPTRLPPRRPRDDALSREIRRVYDESFQVYGAREVWRQLQREGFAVARCTALRLMRALGPQGVRRRARTTVPETQADRPVDHVNRQFQATRPNELWAGFVYVAFVVDVFARRIIGWRVSRSMKAELVLDALEAGSVGALRRPGGRALGGQGGGFVRQRPGQDDHRSLQDRGVHHRGPWRHLEAVEFATLEWVDRFNHRRLLESIRHIPPVELEAAYYRQQREWARAARLN